MLLVDPGITVPEVEGLAAEIERRGWHVEAAVSTHPHWDHVLWHPRLGQVPRWATRAAVEAQDRTRADDLAKVDADAPGHDHDLFGRLTALPDDADALPWDGPRAVLVRHAAHAPGHLALVLPDREVMVVGDMLSDLEIPLLDTDADDPVGDYRVALDLLEQAARMHGVTAVVPGHGHVGDATELDRRLDADRAYLDDLASGREPHDPRLADPWLAGEHRRHVARLTRS